MSERCSQIILLCEDEAHERLARAYMHRAGLRKLDRIVRALVASRMQHGGNVGWVVERFPQELQACRKRRAKTLLIVIIDADTFSVAERLRQLADRLNQVNAPPLGESDAMALLIPKRSVETWICALAGQKVTEEDDCKAQIKLNREVFRQSADTLFEWARPNATQGPTCVDSLLTALPHWRRID